jgi:dihydrodipicolinate synthase/N-acetylneuraminate lyase
MADRNEQPSLASGLYAALAMPRRADSLEADTGALLDYLDAVTDAGVDGLVLFGSTGEFVHFEVEERRRVSALAIKRSRLPVLINASHSTLAGAVALAESAIEAGAAGLMLTPPFFYTYGDDQIFEFYRQFLNQAGHDIPVYLYNLPMFLNPISPSLATRLLETGKFAGIKDSSGDWGSFESLRLLRQKIKFQLLLGNECLYLQGRATAEGAISGLAGAIPELMIALERSVAASDHERSRQLNERLLEFLNWVNKFPASVIIKRAAAARGWNVKHFAVPLDEGAAADLGTFQSWFEQWFPAVLAECNRSPAVRP